MLQDMAWLTCTAMLPCWLCRQALRRILYSLPTVTWPEGHCLYSTLQVQSNDDYNLHQLSSTVKPHKVDSPGMPHLHFHLLLGSAVAMPYDADDTPQLQHSTIQCCCRCQIFCRHQVVRRVKLRRQALQDGASQHLSGILVILLGRLHKTEPIDITDVGHAWSS